VSRYVLSPSLSLDCVSVFGRTVDDAVRVLSTISGSDPLGCTYRGPGPHYGCRRLCPTLRGLTVGLPQEYFPSGPRRGRCGCAPRTTEQIREPRRGGSPGVAAQLGLARCRPTTSSRPRKQRRIWPARRCPLRQARVGPEGISVHCIAPTRGEDSARKWRRRILVGTYVLSAGYYDAYYKKAQQVRALMADDFRRVFDSGVDLLLTPTTPTPAFKAGEKTEDPVAMYWPMCRAAR